MKDEIKPIELTIEAEIEDLSVIGVFKPIDHTKQNRKVYLDGYRAPKFIEKAIIHYMDYQMHEYLEYMKKQMEDGEI